MISRIFTVNIVFAAALVCQGCNTASLHLGMTDEQVVDWTHERFKAGDSTPLVREKLRTNGLSVFNIGLAPDRNTFEPDSDRAMFVEVHEPGVRIVNDLQHYKSLKTGNLRFYFNEQARLEVIHWVRPIKREQPEWGFVDSDPVRIELVEAEL